MDYLVRNAVNELKVRKNIFGVVPDELYTKITQIRRMKDFSQQYMAEELGIAENTYSRTERGEIALTWERIQQIAKVFKLTPIELISYNSRLMKLEEGREVYKTRDELKDCKQELKELQLKYQDVLEENRALARRVK